MITAMCLPWPMDASVVFFAVCARCDLVLLWTQLAELERSRQRRAREQKILDDQRMSDYNDPAFRLFNDRYVRLNMLGKGGFSEVWKAFDLEELRYVAVKIHRLRREWPEQWRRNYTKHAEREYNIHRSLQHPNVIPLHAVFSIDDYSFCTVLELCGGCDLDMYLKLHHTVPEDEARVIIAQVLSGLLYLHNQERRIIHYDLKPGNILYDQGSALDSRLAPDSIHVLTLSHCGLCHATLSLLRVIHSITKTSEVGRFRPVEADAEPTGRQYRTDFPRRGDSLVSSAGVFCIRSSLHFTQGQRCSAAAPLFLPSMRFNSLLIHATTRSRLHGMDIIRWISGPQESSCISCCSGRSPSVTDCPRMLSCTGARSRTLAL